MADRAALIARIRNELGDFGKSFRQAMVGDGETDRYDLPVSQVSQTGFKVFTLNSGTIVNLVAPTDYTMDYRNSVITLPEPLEDGVTLVAEGTAYGLFSDEDLGHYLDQAVGQHTHGATSTIRYRDASGFIRYSSAPVSVRTLPELEEVLVVMLATVEALWTLSNDASTDIDVNTAEGTFVPRSQRYRQILNQIELLTEKYRTLSQQLNVGLFRVEITDLRRTSRTTGRLVPLYVSREYDDNLYMPIRKLPPIDQGHTELDPQPLNSDVTTVDLDIYAGDDYAFEVDLPFDLTGCVVASSIRNTTGPLMPNSPMAYQLVPFTIDVLNVSTGTVRLSLTGAQTARLHPYCKYDLQVTDANNEVTTYLQGTVRTDVDQVTR